MRYGNRRRVGGRTLGRSAGGFLKEAPKPPRTFLEFIFDRTNALRQSHAESLFQSQFNAARVQPPDTCMTGATSNAGGQAPAGCLLLRFSLCRKRFNAGVPGAVAPGKIILESPPSPEGKGGRIKTKGRAGRRPKTQAAHANITAAVSTGNAGGKPPPGACFSGSACAASGLMLGMQGRSPLHEITLVSPFPAGEERSASAGRGDILPLRGRGAESKTKGSVGRHPKRQATPASTTAAVSTGNAGASPRQVPASQVQPVPQAV